MPIILQVHDLLHVEEVKHSAITGIIHGLVLSFEGVKFEVLVQNGDGVPQLSTRKLEVLNPIQSAPQAGSAVLEVHAGDVIELRSKNAGAELKLEAFGKWWRVHGGYRKGSHWLLNSVPRQPRMVADKVYNTLIIQKTDDADFEILRVCVFPREFIYKEWK